MIRVGVIGGTHILEMRALEEVEETEVETPYGTAEVEIGVMGGKKVALIQRHGRRKDKPPHVINHAANFSAFKKLGVGYVIGMGSVGCLRADIELPAIIVPDDYIDFFSGATIFNSSLTHITPGFDEELRGVLLKVAKSMSEFPVVERGVYFQTRGPRLETKAEIRMIRNFADCVGMTAGSEATIAKEMGLRYAAICTMDNYAHGIRDEEIDYREIVRRAGENAKVCLNIVCEAVRILYEGVF